MPEWRQALVLDPGETIGVALMSYHDTIAEEGWRDNCRINWLDAVSIKDLLGAPEMDPGLYDREKHKLAHRPLIRYWVEHVDVVVYEEFRLYPDKAARLAGTTLPTVQCIGGIRCAVNWSRRQPEIHSQGASDMGVMEAKLGYWGIELESSDRQEKSAELHAWFWYFKGRHRGKERPL